MLQRNVKLFFEILEVGLDLSEFNIGNELTDSIRQSTICSRLYIFRVDVTRIVVHDLTESENTGSVPPQKDHDSSNSFFSSILMSGKFGRELTLVGFDGS